MKRIRSTKGILQLTTPFDSTIPLLVTITDEEGYSKRFYYNHSNRLSKSEETADKVNDHAVTYTYDYEGNKLTETDARNNTTQFTYDNLGRLIKTIDALGNETAFTYNALNQVRTKKEPGDKLTEYIYDALGRVSVKKIYQQGSSDYIYTNYSYDQAGNVTNVKQGMVKDGINQLSADISYAYDVMNNLTDEYVKMDETKTGHTSYAYDHNGNRIQVVEYANQEQTKFRIYTFAYNYAGKVKEESGAYKEADGQGSYNVYGNYHKKYERDYAGNLVKEYVLNAGNVYDLTTYTYNYRNKLKEKLEPFANNQNTKKTSYQYDKVGNLIAQTQSIKGVASTTSYQYDGLGRITKKIDPLGNTARYLYDANGNLIKEIDPRYFHLSAEAAPGIEYQYDALNRRIKAIVFDGSTRVVISYKEFDGRGNLVKEFDGEGYNTANPSQSIGNVYEYNVYDQLVTYSSAQIDAVNKNNGTEHVTNQFTYDSLGNILTEQDALGNRTTYAYYLNGQLKEKIWPDGIKESYDYDLTGKVTAIKTDRAGNRTTTYNNIFNKPYRIEYPDGTLVRFVYSPKGEAIESYDQTGNVKYYSYDPSGNMTTKQEWMKADADYTYYKLVKNNYDEANRLINSETFSYKKPNRIGLAQESLSAGDKVEYVYDKAGRLTRIVGPFDRETINEYDQAGNLIAKKQKIADGEYDVKRYAYDVRSQVMSEATLVKTADLEIQYLTGAKYDNTYYDRVLATTSYTYYLNGQLKSKTDPQGHATNYEYDYDKRLVKKIDPLQEATTYRYDLKGNLVEEINANGVSSYYEYDNLNRLIRKKTPAADGTLAVTRYIYDVMGNLIKQVLPNDYDPVKDTAALADTMLGIAYVYDKMNRRISTVSPDGQIIEYIKYNNLGQAVKVADGLRYNGDMETTKGTVYQYDGLGRVIQETNALGQSTYYQYDVLGSLIKLTNAKNNTTTYTYNPDQTLAKITFPDGGVISYTYNKLGRKTSQTDQRGNTITFTYNALGKQKEMKDPYNQTITMKYDLNGNLVSQKDKKGSITLFKYDASNRLTTKKTPLELDGSSNITYAIETYTYDQVGNVSRQTITSSKDKTFIRETSYTYYNNNLVHTVSDNSGSYTSYDYDKNGNQIKIERLREADLYDIEKLEYDNQNRLVKHIRLLDQEALGTSFAGLTDPEYSGMIQSVTSYHYDILGNQTAETDPRGYTITYTYDLLNRLDQIIRKHNGTEVYQQFTYDAVGNKTAVRNERGYLTQYTYDSMNRFMTTTDTNSNTISYTYDLAGTSQRHQCQRRHHDLQLRQAQPSRDHHRCV